jgi:hypothetical protein
VLRGDLCRRHADPSWISRWRRRAPGCSWRDP